MHKGFVFLDDHGRRWSRFRIACGCGILVCIACCVVFVKSLIVCPRLATVQQIQDIKKNIKALPQVNIAVPPSRLPPAWMKSVARTASVQRPPSDGQQQPVRLGFYAGWDPASYASLEKNGTILTHIAPEWFSITGVPPVLTAKPDERVLAYVQDHGVKLMPQVTNLHRQWHPEAIESLLMADAQKQRAFCEELVSGLRDIDAAGAVLDFQEVDPSYRDAFSDFLETIGTVFHESDLELWLCIPPGDDIALYNLDELAQSVDRFVALLYDENGEDDSPGPIASMHWFRTWLDVLTAHGQPSQWVVGIGSYGYDWQDGESADTLSFADCMARAAYALEGVLEDDAELHGPHFTYTVSGRVHTVWFLDAVTLFNHLTYASSKGTGGIALYRLGCEDPGVWEVLNQGSAAVPQQFEKLPSGGMLAHIGEGDFISAADERIEGKRTITVDADGIWHERYVSYPRYTLLTHWNPESRTMVALTFDDGPDPEWTPRILDILKAYNVSAAFFVTGVNARQHPELILRIVAEGHELGNHTYNHVELTGMPTPLVRLELNATQRILEGITGRSTILFRPPYNADRRPGSVEEVAPLLIANELGYITVSQSIDSEDWNAAGPEIILQRVKQRRQDGSVLLLHDAGGDRSATCAALPLIIEYLQHRGDQIVPLRSLLNLPAASLMPPIQPADKTEELRIATTGFRLMHWVEQLCWAFMIVSTVLVCCRTMVLIVLAWSNRCRSKNAPAPPVEPVSVVIAAHNEEKVIGATLASILATTYPAELEVIVIDDGSQDATATMVEEIAARDPRIRLIRQAKQGKAAALNAGLNAASHRFVVTLDADTQFLPDTISALLRPFADPSVGAVSGHVRVGNTGTWLGRFQELEYICGFNLDRRAYDQWNCITVVPGAVSAFRREALQRAGGLSDDTLAEDTDLTLMLHRLGYVVRFADDAVAFTEVPETLRGLTRQRIRWAFGTLQCLWKHRDLLFFARNKALGFFSLPGVWLFHFFLVALIPFIDILLLGSLTMGAGHAIADYAIAFLSLDFMIAIVACHIDGTSLARAVRILPMRFLYRPILAWAVWAALLRAMKGVWVAWGRQERRGVPLLGTVTYPAGVE